MIRKINFYEVITLMERPIGRSGQMRLVGRTQSIEEAERISKQYEAQGFKTKIVKRSQAGMDLYEVYAGKDDVLTAE